MSVLRVLGVQDVLEVLEVDWSRIMNLHALILYIREETYQSNV